MLNSNDRAFIKHVKGLFDPEFLLALRENFVQLEAKQSADGVSEREKFAMERGESSDRLRMQSTWYDMWRHPIDREVLLNTVSPYTYVMFPVQVRNVRQAHHHVPWHQDIGYMRLLGDRGHKQVITCFVPLELNPAKHTTIQFATDNHDRDCNHEYPHVALDGFGAGIDNNDFKNLIHFDLNLGDALIFGDFALHRTFLPENCEVNRRSLEFRLLMPEHRIAGKDYFDLNLLRFVKVEEGQKEIASEIA